MNVKKLMNFGLLLGLLFTCGATSGMWMSDVRIKTASDQPSTNLYPLLQDKLNGTSELTKCHNEFKCQLTLRYGRGQKMHKSMAPAQRHDSFCSLIGQLLPSIGGSLPLQYAFSEHLPLSAKLVAIPTLVGGFLFTVLIGNYQHRHQSFEVGEPLQKSYSNYQAALTKGTQLPTNNLSVGLYSDLNQFICKGIKNGDLCDRCLWPESPKDTNLTGNTVIDNINTQYQKLPEVRTSDEARKTHVDHERASNWLAQEHREDNLKKIKNGQ